MPPRATKRGGPGNRRAGRGRGAAKVQVLPEESNAKVEKDVGVDLEKLPIETEKEIQHNETVKAEEEKAIDDNRGASEKKEDHAKMPVDEFEKDEQLDLEDNEVEYEHEEYGGVDDDQKVIDQDPRDEIDEIEEEPEEADLGEEEGYVVDEEIDELEPEEGDEHARETCPEMVDEKEHEELVKERRKRKEFEIFVGGLDKDATESDLREVFSEVGKVTEVRLMMNPHTKKNKGFAFLRFATVEQAKRACLELKNPLVHGKQCGVSPSQDSDTLFLGNICKTWTKETLKEKLKHYGVENIEDLTLVEDNNSDGMNRGFAFLEFASRSDAMDTFKRLQKRNVMFGVDRPAKVSFADSFIDPGDEIMAQVKTVFVDGLTASWEESHVKELLKKYGKIEKVELARNMPSARRKDFGFVTFDTHDAAVSCAKSINNAELGEGEHKAKVRARLSRPLQRSKGKSLAHVDFHPGRGSTRGGRSAWSNPVSRGISFRGPRGIEPRLPYPADRGFKRPAAIRERRPIMAVPPSRSPVATMTRSYDRRPPPGPSYPKRGLNRDYGHRQEPHPRSRAPVEYSSRFPSDRRQPYRDYSPRELGYPDLPRGVGASRSTSEKVYVDEGYNPRYERPPITHREGHGRGYDSLSGSKRPYADMDDIPPRYSVSGVRQSRSRLEYYDGTSDSHYGDGYSESGRLGRSNIGYGSSRSSLSSHDPHEFYSSRHGMGYGGGSYGSGGDGGMYSSSYGDDYMSSRGSEAGASSYSSLYSGRSSGGSGYMGSGGSGSGSYY